MSDSTLFTFIIERLGWTIVQQVPGLTLRDAVRDWAVSSADIGGMNVETDAFVAPSPVDGTTNAWFFSTRDVDENAVFVNVVATVRDEVASGY